MPGQIRGDIDRMTNTVISVAEEARQLIRWGQYLIREIVDGASITITNPTDKPPMESGLAFLKGETKEFPIGFRVNVKEKDE